MDFKNFMTNLKKYTQDELLIGMEDTGHYNFAIKSCLLAKGYKVALINPILPLRTLEKLL